MQTRGAFALMLTAGLVLMTGLTQAAELSLSAEPPGNLFAFGKPVAVTVQGKDVTELAWTCTDYWETEVAKGTATLEDGNGMIAVGDLSRGYYELVCTAPGASATLPFGVVTDHSAVDPPSTRLNVDGATAWLSQVEDLDELAKILRLCGIGWVRERFAWGAHELERGKAQYEYKGRDYDRVADAYNNQGVRVYQIFHDSPGWTHAGNNATKNPEDLRDVYAFTKRVAEHYSGLVQAWEVWNEPDIAFWPDLGDTFAGVQKAAYLGFKAGDSELPVLMGSFCRGYSDFDENLFESGVQDYFDIFNWHIYAGPDAYPGVLARYLELLERYECDNRPVWLTEAGVRLQATEPDGELNVFNERKQAEFIAPSFASSLQAGTDRHFFFVYPWYLENGIQFGALRKDLSPRPGFVAIAAAVDILGEATYLGQYDFGDAAAGETGLAFDSGEQNVLVLWARQDATVEIETGAERVELADLLGRRSSKATQDGKLSLEIGPSPQYIIGLGNSARERLTGEVRDRGEMPQNSPSPLVIRGQAQVTELLKDRNCYLIGTDPFTYAVEVCNLSETGSAKGTVRVEAPEGWAVDPNEAAVELEPMGRTVIEFTLTAAAAHVGPQKVWVRGDFGDLNPAPSVSYFRFDVSRVTPAAVLDLGLGDPARWESNISNNGEIETSAIDGGGVRFVAKFIRPGDRWCYPRTIFDPVQDWSGYDGISFDYRTEGDDAIYVRTQAIEQGGSSYLGDVGRASDEWRHVAVLFSDLHWGNWSAEDANEKLDLNEIASLMIGLNTNKDDVVLQIREVKLFKLQD